jgi:hypothetical protein
MKRSITTSFRVLFLGLGILCIGVTAHAQPPGGPPFNPTHYWTYQMPEAVPAPQPIFAADQFFRGGVPLTVERRERLLNWVSKNNSLVPDTLLHYTWWNILEKLPVNRRVIVSNQFGSFPVQVLNLEFMLAPALKNQAAPALPQANHYLCYRATGFPAPPTAFDLRDEWRVDIQQPQAIEFLCAPCAKQHLGAFFPVVDTVTHLAAYPITPSSETFSPLVRDQFMSNFEIVKQSPIEWLFVPSEKTDLPVDVKKDTWGRLKKLYR